MQTSESATLLSQLSGIPRPSWIFFIPLGLMLGSGLALYDSRLPEVPVQYLVVVFVVSGWITSLCIHEFGHAVAAYLGGDESVKEAGYLTLNPLKYTHPLNSIGLPLLYLFMGGFGLPGGAVYVNVTALRSRWWQSLTAAAGPLGTIAFHAVILWPFFSAQTASATPFFTYERLAFWSALAFLVLLEITALLFNVLPLPGLDGFGIIEPWLPAPVKHQVDRLGPLPVWLLVLSLWSSRPAAQAFWNAVLGVAAGLHVPINLALLGRDLFTLFR